MPHEFDAPRTIFGSAQSVQVVPEAEFLEEVEVRVVKSSPLLTTRLHEPCAWVAITMILALIVYASVRPEWCTDVERCTAAHADIPYIYHACTASALCAVLLHEIACLCLACRAANSAMRIIHSIRETLLPSVFLCVSFLVLFFENIVFVIGTSPWHAHSMRVGDRKLDGEPVYTVIYVEWLVNVPILLILAGKYALSRPTAEIARPLLVTNAYIILAWTAHFIPSSAGRMATVAACFAMYAWSSYDMIRWVTRFHSDHPDAKLFGRPFLSISLIVIFGIYGMVYLCRQYGALSTSTEKMCFMVMDTSSKLLASMAFAGLRSSQYHNMLLRMAVNTNTVFQRQLREEEPLMDW